MRLNEFIDVYADRVTREYEMSETKFHCKQLCYCRRRVKLEDKSKVLRVPAVVIGILVDMGIEEILGRGKKVYRKKVGKYNVIGTPDIVDGDVVETKFTAYAPKAPREHDVMQLKMYLWLINKDVGYLWYFSPQKYVEFEVGSEYTDIDVLGFIENPKYPMWLWECKHCLVKEGCNYV